MSRTLVLPRRYRICLNQAPHQDDWYTVERLWRVKPWFRKAYDEWVVHQEVAYASVATGIRWKPPRFEYRTEAMAWIKEDQKPRVHECEEVPGAFG